ERLEQIAEDVAEAGEAFERAQLEHFVEQERARLAAGRARRVEEGEQHVERLPRARRLPVAPGHREGGRAGDRLEEPLRRGRAALHIYVLRGRAAEALAQPLQEHGAPRAAAAEDDGNSRRRRVERAHNPSIEPSFLTRHFRNSLCRPLMAEPRKSLWRLTLRSALPAPRGRSLSIAA